MNVQVRKVSSFKNSLKLLEMKEGHPSSLKYVGKHELCSVLPQYNHHLRFVYRHIQDQTDSE